MQQEQKNAQMKDQVQRRQDWLKMDGQQQAIPPQLQPRQIIQAVQDQGMLQSTPINLNLQLGNHYVPVPIYVAA